MSGIRTSWQAMAPRSRVIAVAGLVVPVVLVAALVGGVALGAPAASPSPSLADGALPTASPTFPPLPPTPSPAAVRDARAVRESAARRCRSTPRLRRPADAAPDGHRLPPRAPGQPDRRHDGRLDRPDDGQERRLQRPARYLRFPPAEVRDIRAEGQRALPVPRRQDGRWRQGHEAGVLPCVRHRDRPLRPDRVHRRDQARSATSAVST